MKRIYINEHNRIFPQLSLYIYIKLSQNIKLKVQSLSDNLLKSCIIAFDLFIYLFIYLLLLFTQDDLFST